MTAPLCGGKKYKVGFFANKANKARYAISNLGMRITVLPDSANGTSQNDYVIDVNPQIQNPYNNVLLDTVSWVEISGIYTAQGGEQYITIGNFDYDINTNIFDSVGWLVNNAAYYYIDSVFVIPDSLLEDLITSNDTSICAGASIELASLAGDNSLWQTANGDTLGIGSILTFSPAASTTVYLQSCQARDSIYIVVNHDSVPSFSLGSDTVLCSNQTLVLGAGNWAAYHWSTGATSQQIAVDSSGVYSVTVTGFSGCVAYDSMLVSFDSCLTIHSYPEPRIVIYSNPFTNGFELNITGVTSTVQLTITNTLGQRIHQAVLSPDGQTIHRTVDLPGLPAGVYAVTLRANGSVYTRNVVKK